MRQQTYRFAYRTIETADITKNGLVSKCVFTMKRMLSKLRFSRGYGSKRTYYLHNF